MTDFYNVEAPENPANVCINSDLPSQARSLKINLSVAHITISMLNPVLEIDGDRFTAMAQDMAGVDRNQFGGRELCDLTHYRAEIIAAV